MGWQAKVSRFPDPQDPRHLATIEVAPHTPDQADITLAAAIPRRRTDRRSYSSWPVAGGDIALMAAARLDAGSCCVKSRPWSR